MDPSCTQCHRRGYRQVWPLDRTADRRGTNTHLYTFSFYFSLHLQHKYTHVYLIQDAHVLTHPSSTVFVNFCLLGREKPDDDDQRVAETGTVVLYNSVFVMKSGKI